MNWTHALLAGYIGVVAVIVVMLYRRKGNVGKISSVVLVLVALVAWNLFDVWYLMPREQKSGVVAESEMDAAFRAMDNMPTYQVLREQEPALMETIRTTAKAMQKEGKTQQQIIDYIQPQVLSVQMSRVQNAPDENVIAYMKINMEQTAAIQKVSDDNCFRFLFPAVKGGINPARILSRDFLINRMNIDAAMMRAAYGTGRHTVTDKERQDAQQNIQPIIAVLVKKYGQDIEIMPDPRKAIGKEKVACEIVQDLWKNVLALPQDKAAGIIRMMTAAENQ
jgi:hypothetical protein